MTFFKIKNGEVKKVAAQDTPGLNIDRLVEYTALTDTLLPEKLVVIDERPGDTVDRMLLALDEDASLVVVLICAKAPKERSIADATDLAWDLRFVEYDQLNHLSHLYFSAQGVAAGDIAELHKQHFSLGEQVSASRFNKTQRVIVLAPDFSSNMLHRLNVRRFELDIDAYRLQTVMLDSGDEFLSVEPVDFLKNSRLASLFSLLLDAPFKPVRKLFNRFFPS